MDGFPDWTTLLTYSGASVMTGMIVQVTKNFPIIKNLWTQLWSYLVAFGVLILATNFTTGINIESTAAIFLYAFMVAFACNGGYSLGCKIKDAVEDESKPLWFQIKAFLKNLLQ